MNIGILTFHYAHNYGAVLQAWALKNYLEELGHNVYILNYINQNVKKEYPQKLKPVFPKKYILNPKRWKYIFQQIEKCRLSKECWRIQYNKFENFINCQLMDENQNEWENIAQKCEIIFFGSDQIWERNIVGNRERVYFGNFTSKAKKVSYGASCFDPTKFISKDDLKFINNFKYISTREKELADVIKKNFPEKKVKTVVDPVFLINKDKYFKIANFKEKNYILFYFVSENEELSKISNYLKNVKNKRIIEIHYFKNKVISNDWQIADVGPEEFIGFIINADMIITNSFHGTAFSLIFQKKFWTLSRNTRITDILKRFDMLDRCITSYEDWEKKEKCEINYTDFDSKMNFLVKKSKEYIDYVLGEK